MTINSEQQSKIDAIRDLERQIISSTTDMFTGANGYKCDPRWLSIAKTQLQLGFMALERSVWEATTNEQKH